MKKGFFSILLFSCFFDFVGKGLAINDGNAVRELVIAGADKRFVPAMARISFQNR